MVEICPMLLIYYFSACGLIILLCRASRLSMSTVKRNTFIACSWQIIQVLSYCCLVCWTSYSHTVDSYLLDSRMINGVYFLTELEKTFYGTCGRGFCEATYYLFPCFVYAPQDLRSKVSQCYIVTIFSCRWRYLGVNNTFTDYLLTFYSHAHVFFCSF